MSASRLHALILEDHSTAALSLKAALGAMGFSTFGFASTATQALAAAKARKPDLVISSLSVHSGFETDALAALNDEIEGAPIIFTTDGEEAVDEALVLQRPVGRAALSRAWDSLRGEDAAA